MKTAYLLSLAFLFFYLPAKAQLTFGIRGSFIDATQVINEAKTPKVQGLGTTFSLYKRVNKFLEIGTEPGVVQRGTGQQIADGYYYYAPTTFCGFGCFVSSYYPTYTTTSGLKTTHLQLPAMARLSLPMAKGKLAIFGKIGAGPSWLAAGTYESEVLDEDTFDILPETRTFTFSDEEGIKRWEWGWYTGAGIGYQTGFGMLSFETEFYRSLTGMSTYTEIRNRSTSYSLGFSVQL